MIKETDELEDKDRKGIPIRSISRALNVLQIINREGSVCLMEIAKQSELPYPSVCRIVQTLVAEGMIERETSRKYYRPSANVQTLSYGYQEHSELVRVSRPLIENLTRDLGWPVSILTRVGNTMVLRDSTHAMTTLTLAQYYPGYSMPIAYCAAGKAYLSALPMEELDFFREKLGPRIPVPGDPNCVLDPLYDLDEVREQGFALVERVQHTVHPGRTSGISMPLFNHGRVVGVIAIAYFSSALSKDEALSNLIEPLRSTRNKIATALSGGSAPLKSISAA